MEELARSQVDALFAQALDRPAAERLEYLETACAGDDRLLAAISELLRLADGPVAGLDRGAWCSGALLRELASELESRFEAGAVGDLVGPWRLVRELGRGGMGTVYLAERADGEYERTVALKLLQAGIGSEEGLQRFEQERQILATLEHPNIARLIDGGHTGDGRPYLVMEHVLGRPIDVYCEQERLGLDARLELFIGVAKAVQSAHRRLVVHRDLKSSNILVADAGTPKLLDFGIAKLLQPAPDREPLTQTFARVLTPEYASPEQVRGEAITTASDVYQLGLLLFELLTGERVHRLEAAATPGEIERAICDEETPRPSSVIASAVAELRTPAPALAARAVRGDLDNIVLRALNKEPDRRYGSAAELVADVESYRQGYPITARPDTVWYRVSRFVRRHRVGVSAATLVGLLLSSYAVTVTIQQRRIQEEADRAREAVAFVTRIFTDFAQGKVGSGEASALEVVDRGALKARTELTDRPDLQAAMLAGFGELYMHLGRYDRAIPSLEAALDIRSRRLARFDPVIGDTAVLLGRNLHYAGQLREGVPPLRRAQEIYRHTYGDGDDKACQARGHLGDLLHSLGDLPAAEAELRAAVENCGEPLAHRDLANVLRDRGDLEAALALYSIALEKLIAAEGDRSRHVGLTHLNWGYALTLAGDLEGAAVALDRTIEIEEFQYGTDHPVTAMGLRYRGQLALARGETAEAERLIRRSLSILRGWLGDEHHLVPRHWAALASIALAEERPARALQWAGEALSRYDRLEIPDHPKALEAQQVRAAALLEIGEVERAIDELRDVITRQKALFVPADPRLGASFALLAEALELAGDHEPVAGLRASAREIFAELPASSVLYCRTYRSSVGAAAPGGCPS